MKEELDVDIYINSCSFEKPYINEPSTFVTEITGRIYIGSGNIRKIKIGTLRVRTSEVLYAW